ncbi:hypothetical protein P7K49_021154 [Saguinus oedipus]|uniref:Uncharacterized protein n=1 Tax=Saguinus oedipus TaxID=9490 RepID=A0ABQ9URW1_SAGOE|nr:hypothetical protein P7K49_021154 [Saguinus oedipus]
MFWVLANMLHKKKKKSSKKSAELGLGNSVPPERRWWGPGQGNGKSQSKNRGPGGHLTQGTGSAVREGGLSALSGSLSHCSSGAREEWAQAREAESIILKERSLIEVRKNGKMSGVGVARVSGIREQAVEEAQVLAGSMGMPREGSAFRAQGCIPATPGLQGKRTPEETPDPAVPTLADLPVPLLCWGGLENEPVFRPDLLQPPTSRAGSRPQGGGCAADALFLIK